MSARRHISMLEVLEGERDDLSTRIARLERINAALVEAAKYLLERAEERGPVSNDCILTGEPRERLRAVLALAEKGGQP